MTEVTYTVYGKDLTKVENVPNLPLAKEYLEQAGGGRIETVYTPVKSW
jgi:hypothetical protein